MSIKNVCAGFLQLHFQNETVIYKNKIDVCKMRVSFTKRESCEKQRKPGKIITKWDFRLQNWAVIYKMGIS